MKQNKQDNIHITIQNNTKQYEQKQQHAKTYTNHTKRHKNANHTKHTTVVKQYNKHINNIQKNIQNTLKQYNSIQNNTKPYKTHKNTTNISKTYGTIQKKQSPTKRVACMPGTSCCLCGLQNPRPVCTAAGAAWGTD